MGEMVTISRAEYAALLRAREDMEDIQAFARAVADGRESIPSAVVARILDGESPLRAFRGWRGLTQSDLGRMSGVNRVTVAEIESGRKVGSVGTLKSLAKALGVQVDDLI